MVVVTKDHLSLILVVSMAVTTMKSLDLAHVVNMVVEVGVVAVVVAKDHLGLILVVGVVIVAKMIPGLNVEEVIEAEAVMGREWDVVMCVQPPLSCCLSSHRTAIRSFSK
jgi:hypothetical protein